MRSVIVQFWSSSVAYAEGGGGWGQGAEGLSIACRVSLFVSCILLTRTLYLCLCSMCRGYSLYTHIHVRKDNLPLPKIAQICTQISQVREVLLFPITTSVTQPIFNFRTGVTCLSCNTSTQNSKRVTNQMLT